MQPPGGPGHGPCRVCNNTRGCLALCAGSRTTKILVLLAGLWASFQGLLVAGALQMDVLRLANGPSRCAGRVEILHNGQWGTVCDDDWDLEEARVVCRELSCGAALSAPGSAHFGQGSGQIWLDDVNCMGTEDALSTCRAKPWGEHNCNHGEDAGVVCSGTTEPAPLRLANGPSRCAGRVEVQHSQEWGTVCDDNWNLHNAAVVCWQLGCGAAMSAPGSAHFGPGTGRIWLDNVNCMGTEDGLSACRAGPWGKHNCNHGEDAGVVCSEPSALRLVNGSGRCSGRVEVLHDQRWGSVCDDSWDLEEARVVCRELGCGAALSAPGSAHFGQGSGQIWLDDVNCMGTEDALSTCRAKPWGEHNCNHGEDAGVVCSEPTPLRLVNGSNRCAGRVEVLREQQWGTVCDDGWDLRDAAVVCQQLGCGLALMALGSARFGPGSGHIWLDDVNCAGTEASLAECRARPRGAHNCHHGEDAGVICAEPPQLRLVNGSGPCTGRVEVLHDQQWGTVCDEDWDLLDAEVVCWQLGCGAALSAPGAAHFGQGHGSIWLAEVQCQGGEAALAQCRATPWGQNHCHHGQDAGAVCAEPPRLRLVNGSSRCSGRVEVHHRQGWGSVCDHSWDLLDAEVVCRELGCGAAQSVHGKAHFGRGHDPIWLDGVQCRGTEAALSACRAQPWGSHNCSHEEDAGVVCAEPSEVRLVNGSGRCSGRVEVLHDQRWGSVCDDGWDLLDAEVVCRELGCGAALSAPGSARFGRGRDPIWLDGVSCTGTEGALSECRARPWGVHTCSHAEDAAVVCSDPTEVRLVNGSGRCSGRVEVLHDQRWGSICDNDWDLLDAEVVCWYLGCGAALSAPGSARFGQGYGPFWLDRVHCTGREAALSECRAEPWGAHNCSHGEEASVVCAEPPALRLVNGSSPCTGRVEVLHNQTWGNVCAEGWDMQDAEVLCRELGCGLALSAPGKADFGQGKGPIWLVNLSCLGTEAALSECVGMPWGIQPCHHREDVSVECSEPAMLRLVNGSSNCSGRVEVLHAQQWGSVCDDGWDVRDAEVVCRQLGCGTVLYAPHLVQFGRGPGRVWLGDVNCTGTETALSKCPAGAWGEGSCRSREDASVVCSGTAVSSSSLPLPMPLLLGLVTSLALTLLIGAFLLLMKKRPRSRAFLHSAGNELELNSLGTLWIQGGGHLTAMAEVPEDPGNEMVWLVKAKRVTLPQDKPEGEQEKNCSFLPNTAS